MLEKFLATEVLKVWVLNPTGAHFFVGQREHVLEQQKPDHEPRLDPPDKSRSPYSQENRPPNPKNLQIRILPHGRPSLRTEPFPGFSRGTNESNYRSGPAHSLPLQDVPLDPACSECRSSDLVMALKRGCSISKATPPTCTASRRHDRLATINDRLGRPEPAPADDRTATASGTIGLDDGFRDRAASQAHLILHLIRSQNLDDQA